MRSLLLDQGLTKLMVEKGLVSPLSRCGRSSGTDGPLQFYSEISGRVGYAMYASLLCVTYQYIVSAKSHDAVHQHYTY